jgi:hypothetical protein
MIKIAREMEMAREMEIGRKIERWGCGNSRGKLEIEIEIQRNVYS